MPEKIENVFALCPLVSQTFLHGDSKKSCCVAIVVPEMGKVKRWAEETGKLLLDNTPDLCLGKDTSDLGKVARSADFKKYMMGELDALGKQHKLSGLERPKDIFVTDDAFSVDNDLLTPTFKLKRHKCKEYFKD